MRPARSHAGGMETLSANFAQLELWSVLCPLITGRRTLRSSSGFERFPRIFTHLPCTCLIFCSTLRTNCFGSCLSSYAYLWTSDSFVGDALSGQFGEQQR